MPAGSVTGRSLTLVITIMCFLACLTAGAVYMMNQSASAWLRDIASEVTVQVEARQRTDMDKMVADVARFLSQRPGIVSVRPLSVGDSAQLLEPWLGQTDALSALPIPRIIAVELDRNTPPDFEQLRAALNKEFKDVTLDDHRRWQAQIRTITRSFALGGLAILLLVGAATTAVIVSATKSAMASNRDIVEVLHFVGATDRFIAREFDKHFLRLGVRAGLVGAVLAGLVFLLMPSLMQLLGGGTVTVGRDGTIATVTLSSPGRMNALDKTMWAQLGAAMRDLGADESLRCVVIRGDGDKAFAAGADIAEFRNERADSKQAKAYSQGGIGWMHSVSDCRHPTVALIQGACVGGGLLIASQCDLRICNESARFGVPVKNLGLTESYDELQAMMRVIGPVASLEILLEGRIWGAREAYEKGLVSRVAPDAGVVEEAYATARRIACNPAW